ncbi:MAG: histidinol-phosphate transaminase [Candidatus Thioglobus sp.]|nr:histidinol-phosphate transaminase [Candidatus Thioglobus sp.]
MSFINHWLRPSILAASAYSTPPADGLLKLDAMESPFALADDLSAKYLTHLAKAELNRYPNPNASELQKTLRELMNIPDEFGLLLGNGSDELIQLLALACDSEATILSVEPSFVMYNLVAKSTHLNYVGVNLDADFQLDLPKIQAAIKTHQPKLIFIAYPNNPTGNSFERQSVEKIITATDALVVLDEAYYAYSADSFLADIAKFPNLVVLRTVSKIGFAGLRLGLLIGSKSTISELDKLRLPYNINTLTQISAEFLLQQKDQIDKNAQIILAERKRVFASLNALNNLRAYPSDANFILFKTPNAQGLFDYLKANKILIKNLTNSPKLQNCLRVTIGNYEQNQQFLSAVKTFQKG